MYIFGLLAAQAIAVPLPLAVAVGPLRSGSSVTIA